MPATYKIPQNVDLEDKILGPLTLKQFLYALAAGMVTFVTFSAFYKTPLRPAFYVISTVAWILTAALVFVRPNDQSFSKFLFALLSYTTNPSRRVWKRIPSLNQISLEEKPKKAVVTQVAPTSEEVRSRLQRLAHVVDTRGWSTVEDELDGRVTSAQTATAKLNVNLSASDEPEDILAAEDEARGSDRATRELARLIHQGVAKPSLKAAPAPQPKPAETKAPDSVPKAVADQVREATEKDHRPLAPTAELDLSDGDHEEVIPSP